MCKLALLFVLLIVFNLPIVLLFVEHTHQSHLLSDTIKCANQFLANFDIRTIQTITHRTFDSIEL